MRPVQELRVPVDLVGLAFDVDDTVTRNGVLEFSALRSMHRLHDAGLRLIAVTGRPLGWAEVFSRTWPIDGAVGENGAGWFWRDGSRWREGQLATELQRQEIAAVHAQIRTRVGAELPDAREASDARLRRYDLAYDVAEDYRMSADEKERLDAIIRQAGAEPVTSSVHCHASLGLWDKARGIEAAAHMMFGTFNASKWVFVGDSGNDEAAFSKFALSVGVANVREHKLERPPAYVTRADRGEGFAELSAHLLTQLALMPVLVTQS